MQLEEGQVSPEQLGKLVAELSAANRQLKREIDERRQAEAALRESEARYRSLVDLSPDAIAVHQEGKYVYMNPAGLRLFGADDPEELIGRKVLDLVHPDYREMVGGRIRRAAAGEKLELQEAQLLRLDGEAVTVEAAAAPVAYQGRPAIQVMLRDITARKRAEREIRRMASFPELNPNPALEVNEKGRVIYANPAARQVAKQLDLSEGVRAFLPPDLPERFAAARQGGQRQYAFDLALRDAFYAVSLSFPHDLPTARLYAMDITERRRGEAALRMSEERFRLAFENANVGMALVGLKGRYLQVNEALSQMFGYTRAALEKLTVQDTTHPEDLEISSNFIRQALAGESASARFEKRHVHKNGDVVWASVSISLVRDPRGAPLYFISQVQDITAHQQAEAALRESQKDLNRAQAVAHTGSWRLDVRRNELLWSDENHRIFGIPLGTHLTYEAFLAIVYPEDRDYVDRKWTAALRGEPYDIEHRIVVGDLEKWVRERAELEFDSQGQLLGGFGTTQDISERKQAEAALQKAHDELELRVLERTASLRLANEHLLLEIEERQEAEEALGESEKRLRYLSAQLLDAQEQERRRLAGELHDELGHALLALKLQLKFLDKQLLPEQMTLKAELTSIFNHIDGLIEDVRRLYHDLSPGDLEDLGLTAAIRNMIGDFAAYHPGIHFSVDVPSIDRLFSIPKQTAIYRIFQEALTNIGKHSHPSEVTIAVKKEAHQVLLVIADNGKGFNPTETLGANSLKRKVGLVAMEERVNMMGGSLTIWSREGRGARITFTVPFAAEEEVL